MIEWLRRANAPKPPEDSVALRAAVLGAVYTGVLALYFAGAVEAGSLARNLALLWVGYWFSHVFRHPVPWKWVVKVFLTVGALVALMQFFQALRTLQTVDEARFPLASLFLSVQVLHGFDVPARKDLNFSLGSSLALMAIAGTLAQDLTYGVFLLVYFAFVIAALTLSHRSELASGALGLVVPDHEALPVRARIPWSDMGRAAVPVALCGALIFMLVPQSIASQYFALPFSLGSGLGSNAAGGIMNPGGDSGSRSSGPGYYGFDDRMDLSVRGDLSDDLVMRVRSSAPSMWKGVVFGTYDGRAWEGAGEDGAALAGDVPPYEYPPQFRSLGPRARITQTYYVETEQPNVIFAAGQPDTIWYEGGVTIDALGGVRTPSTLTPGTVYSVVSTRGSASVEELRTLPRETPPEAVQQYLQLPEIPDRVERLARRITANATTDVDKVLAIEDYLRRNYRYSLDSPVPPLGQDAVDHFLFDADVGFCEQFASATAVMLRSLGIPARVVAGYAVGERNPFSGYYEVSASDAHAWVEVWFPRYGWYEFDPTFAIPPAEGGLERSIPLLAAIDSLRRLVADGGPIAKAIAGAVGAVLVALLARFAWRVLEPRRLRRRRRGPLPGAGPVTEAFRRFEQALATRGEARAPSETAAETLARAARYHGGSSRSALRVFEVERYGPLPPGETETAAAVDELDRLARVVREAP